MEIILTKNQKRNWIKTYLEDGRVYRITATARYDDECCNGHNTFAITGQIDEKRGNRWMDYAGGCIHEDIAKHFPELAPLIKWHLCGSNGPMYYIQNTIYLAGERDCWSKLKGEEKDFDEYIIFKNFPIMFEKEREFRDWMMKPGALEIIAVPHANEKDGYKYADKYTFSGYPVEWYKCPFDSQRDAEEWREAMKLGYSFKKICVGWGEGKKRELDAARSTAIWPDATDEELTAPGLEERLQKRLPALMAEFQKTMESLGFIF